MQQSLHRIYSLDILKFLLCLVIATFHLSWRYTPQGYLAVELFFVISGFLLYLHREKYIQDASLTICLKRIKSYYPYYILFLLLSFVFLIRPIHLSDIINSMLFLQFLGVGKKVISNALWFLGCYTYIYLLYVILLKKYSLKLFSFLPFMLILCMINMYSVSTNKSIMWTYEANYYVFGLPFCLLRGVVSMGIGLCFGALAEKYPSGINTGSLVFYSLLIVALIFYIFLGHAGATYDYLISLIGGLLCYFLYNQNKNSPQKKREKLEFLCGLSLPIYIFHPFVLDILRKAGFDIKTFNWFIYISLVLLLAVLVKVLILFLSKLYHNKITKLSVG